ncbi:MAG: HD domain-containing protein [Candidatus Izemoplasmatales bacterium]
MNYEIGTKVDFFGKVEAVNPSTYDTVAINVETEAREKVVVRIPATAPVSLNKLYWFECVAIAFKEKVQLRADVFQSIADKKVDDDEKERLFRIFYQYAPVNLRELRASIESRLAKLENPVVRAITFDLYDKYSEDFYLYPAATKFHHAYISGLAYHTASMLKMADGFAAVYPFLNRDLLTAGIVLHDLTKTLEFDSYEGAEYTLRGKLIGHISLTSNEIALSAERLGFADAEETMLLQHIVLSHHYYGNFGSPKKPNVVEALVIHFIDNIDSKVTVVGEELAKVAPGAFTEPIGVIDKERFYKHKLSK